MKKSPSNKSRILIISANLEIGGIERSLIALLDALDYVGNDIDLMLWRHEGALMQYLPEGPRLLTQIPEYSTFQRPIVQILREGHVGIAFARARSRLSTDFDGWWHGIREPGYLGMQRAWRYALPYLPRIRGKYDLAISFFGPHYLVSERVEADTKIGWIHTDYSRIPVDGSCEAGMWAKLDYIAAVSNECRNAFLDRFPVFSSRTIVVENILSAEHVRQQASEFDASLEMPPCSSSTRILTVGRFCHQKAFDEAVLACRRLVDQEYDVRWYAIGFGPDETKMRRLILEHRLDDRFKILGKKVNPYPYMKACELFVQPSRYEGKAVTVREAQILGKPVLITRYPTSASQLEEGVDGHICEPGVDGIVAGVRRLIDDAAYRERIASTAASRDYSNLNEVEKIYALIDQVSSKTKN